MITANDIATLWVKMTAAFGYRFTETYGRRDPGVWREVLQDLMPADLEAGFRRMLRFHHRNGKTLNGAGMPAAVVAIWPPNSLEFRQYCEQARKDGGLLTPHEAFVEAQSNSYLTHRHWSHELIRAAFECLYREDSQKSVGEPLHDSDYPAFKRYYVALRDAYLATPQSSPNRGVSAGAFSPPQKTAARPFVENARNRCTASIRISPSPVMKIVPPVNEAAENKKNGEAHTAVSLSGRDDRVNR